MPDGSSLKMTVGYVHFRRCWVLIRHFKPAGYDGPFCIYVETMGLIMGEQAAAASSQVESSTAYHLCLYWALQGVKRAGNVFPFIYYRFINTKGHKCVLNETFSLVYHRSGTSISNPLLARDAPANGPEPRPLDLDLDKCRSAYSNLLQPFKQAAIDLPASLAPCDIQLLR